MVLDVVVIFVQSLFTINGSYLQAAGGAMQPVVIVVMETRKRSCKWRVTSCVDISFAAQTVSFVFHLHSCPC